MPRTSARERGSSAFDPYGGMPGFIDTDYNEESFFVRHAYFLGANAPIPRRKPH